MTTQTLTIENTASDLTSVDLTKVSAPSYAMTEVQQFDLTTFSPAQIQDIKKIADTVNFEDSNQILAFGVAPQAQVNQHLNALLDNIRVDETGQVGALAVELSTAIRGLRLPDVKREITGKAWAVKIPIVGKWFSALRAFYENRKMVVEHLNAIEANAQKNIASMRANNGRLDGLVDVTLKNIKQLEIFLAAGQVAVKRGRAHYENERVRLASSKNMEEISRLRDFVEQLNIFETRWTRMHVGYTESLVSVPQIRTTQASTRIAISDTYNTILFTLPALKRALIQTNALNQTKKALEDSERKRELSRMIQSIGSGQLDEVYTMAKSTQGNMDKDVEELTKVADNLLATLERGRQMDVENKAKRDKCAEDLTALKERFVASVMKDHTTFAG
jgi:uncharacterized protein YaaN involved in tellurite resistance